MRESLFSQAGRILSGAEPSQTEKDALTARVLREYPSTRPSLALCSPVIDEAALRSTLKYLIENDTKMTATPGYPLIYSYATNKSLQDEWPLVIEVVVSRMKLLATHDLSQMTPREIVELRMADPARLFIKGEPHGLRKQTSKRWRLISALSIIDQLIDKVLHYNQNKTEIGLWKHIPSCCGMGMDTKEDIDSIYAKVSGPTGGDITLAGSGDVEGFDWSVKEWELILEAKQRIELGRATGTVAATIMLNRAYAISRSTFVIDDGTMYTQTPGFYGIQKSGVFTTGSTNCRIRVFLAWLIGAGWANAMGDDSTEDYVPDAKERYLKLGHKLKFYNRCGKSFSFCSHTFDGKTAIPEDYTKSMYGMLTGSTITTDQISGISHFLRNHPDHDKVLDALSGAPHCEPEARRLASTRRTTTSEL